MVTLNDVAKVAGVSAKTVSRAVNGDREISDATRENILRIADEMEYVPHAQARRLASGQDPLDRAALPAHEPAAVLRAARDELRVRHRDGRCLARTTTSLSSPASCRPASYGGSARVHRRRPHPHAGRLEDWRVETLRELDYPFALIGRCRDNTGLSFIDFDFETALVDAFDFLVGARTLADRPPHVPGVLARGRAGSRDPSRASGSRLRSTKHGLEPVCRRVRPDVSSSAASMTQLLADHPDISAAVGHAQHDCCRCDQCHPGGGTNGARRLLRHRYRLRDRQRPHHPASDRDPLGRPGHRTRRRPDAHP